MANTGNTHTIDKSQSLNVCYVEPNYTGILNEDVTTNGKSYEQAPDLSDFCIAMNLEVELSGRKTIAEADSLGDVNANGKKVLILSWENNSNGKTAVSFMEGTKIYSNIQGVKDVKSLTTNYTDVFYSDVRDYGTTEMFGIKNVNISYKQWMTPEITINFTDIRGVSLFAKTEMRNGNGYDTMSALAQQDVASSFFQCFFTFPYPRFTFYLKGFYGKPVSYEMSLADFRATFDSDSGNFNATAKFVGFAMSFLTDVSFPALLAAPYAQYADKGQKYWERQKKNGRFVVEDNNGNLVGMPTFAEIFDNYKNVEDEVNRLAQTDETLNINIARQKKINKLNVINNAYREWYTIVYNTLHKVREKETFIIVDRDQQGQELYKAIVVLLDGGSGLQSIQSIKDVPWAAGVYPDLVKMTQNLTSAVKSFNEENGAAFPLPSEGLKDYSVWKLLERKAVTTNNSGNTTSSGATYEMEWKVDASCPLNAATLKQYIGTEAMPYSACVENNYTHAIIISLDYLDVSKKISEANTGGMNGMSLTETKKMIRERLNNIACTKMGFKPTLKNFTKITMAHFETLMHMIDSTVRAIQSNKESRKASNLGVAVGKAAIEGTGFIATDVKANAAKDIIIPPFPRLAVRTTDEKGNTTKVEDVWAGDITGSSNFLEAEIVNALLNGADNVGKMLQESIRNHEAGYNTQGTTNGEPVLRLPIPIPLTSFDFALTDNPYGDQSVASSVADFCGRVLLRGVEILGMDFDARTKETRSRILYGSADKYGKWEAENFAALFPYPSKTLKTLLINGTLTAENLIKIGTCADLKNNQPSADGASTVDADNLLVYQQKGKWPWQSAFATPTNKQALIADFSDANNVIACYRYRNKAGQYVYPVQGGSFNYFNEEFKNNVISPNVYTSKNYAFGDMKLSDNSGNTPSYILKIFDNPKVVGRFLSTELKNKGVETSITDKFAGALFNETKYKQMLHLKATDINVKRSFSVAIDEYNSGEGTHYLPSVPPTECKNIFKGDEHCFWDSTERSYDKVYCLDKDGKTVKLERKNEYDSLFGSDGECTMLQYGISEFYYVDKEGEIDYNRSLFGTREFYELTSLEEQMHRFINSVLWSNDQFLAEAIQKEAFIRLPRHFVLKLGAACWCLRENGYCGKRDRELLEHVPLTEEQERVLIGYFKDWCKNNVSLIMSLYSIPVEMFSAYDVDRTKFEQNIIKACKNSPNFWKNYCSICIKDKVTPLKDATGSYAYKLANRQTAENFAVAYSVIKNVLWCNGTKFAFTHTSDEKYVKVNRTSFISQYLTTFLNRLGEIYKTTQKEEENLKVQLAEEPEDTTVDMKIALYSYLKTIYDRWIPNFQFDRDWKIEAFFKDSTEDDDGHSFYFIDSYYNKIGDDMFINVQSLANTLINIITPKSQTINMFNFLCQIFGDSRCMLMSVQNFMDLSVQGNMESMFEPIPYQRMPKPKRHPDFVVFYSYARSSHLNIPNGEYEDDSFDLSTIDKMPLPISTRNPNDGYKIPAFGVAYGKQYQSYFNQIDISMDNPVPTEQSIKAKLAIVQSAMNKFSLDRKVAITGQDLFTIYNNNSYKCRVSMLGCAWVQPLMYFVLLNVPMFRGSYLISNVNHSIEPGHMETVFEGFRMANVATRFNKQPFLSTIDTKKLKEVTIEQRSADIDNTCDYKVYPIEQTDDDKGESYAKELQKVVTADMCSPNTVSLFTGHTLEDCLCAIVDTVAGNINANDALAKHLISTVLYNRYVKGGGTKDYIFNKAYWDALPSSIASRTSGDTTLAIVRKVFTESPSCVLTGLRDTVVTQPVLTTNISVEIDGVRYKSSSKNFPAQTETYPKTIVNDDLKKLFFVGNKSQYLDKGMSSNPVFLHPIVLHHKDGLFCAFDNKETLLWSMEDKGSTVENESKKKATSGTVTYTKFNTTYTKGFVRALQETVNSADALRCDLKVTYVGEKGVIIEQQDGKNDHMAQIYDAMLNGYYFHLARLYWVAKDLSAANPDKIYANISTSTQVHDFAVATDIDTNTGNATMFRCPTGEGLSQQLYLSLVKKYGNVPVASNGVSELKADWKIGGTFSEVSNTLFENVRLQSCAPNPANSVINTGYGTTPRGESIVTKAKTYIGSTSTIVQSLRENPKSDNTARGTNPAVADDWSAAFCSLVYANADVPQTSYPVSISPKEWHPEKSHLGVLVGTPSPGDIVMYTGAAGEINHLGIITKVNESSGSYESIEGDVGGKVKERKGLPLGMAYGFIHF